MDEQKLLVFTATFQGVILLLCSLAVFVLLISVRYRKGLREIPGPFLASILSLDRLLTAASGEQFLTHIKYHKKYGPLVRVGPSHVSFSDASLIPQVYGITTKFYKACSLEQIHPVADTVAEPLLFAL